METLKLNLNEMSPQDFQELLEEKGFESSQLISIVSALFEVYMSSIALSAVALEYAEKENPDFLEDFIKAEAKRHDFTEDTVKKALAIVRQFRASPSTSIH